MSTADLYHMHEGFALCRNHITQLLYPRNRYFTEYLISRNVHRRRKSIVRGLRFVYIIVGTQIFFFVSQFASVDDMTAVCDHFIYIHVALCTASGLPNHEWKLI